jgi:ATP-dependent Clp protease ATP-binding subunit ClpA
VFERFSRSARATVKRAQRVAAEEGAGSVEAEHLLLALTQQASDRTARALHALSVTDVTVRAALDREFADALRAVGVVAPVGPGPSSGLTTSTPRWGQSAKLALMRTLQVALDRGHKRIEDHHILLALTHAEAGVIPRVLRTLDISASDIEAALR